MKKPSFVSIECNFCGKTFLKRRCNIRSGGRNFCKKECCVRAQTKLSSTDITKIAEMYQSGKSSIEIGKVYGVCQSTIIRKLQKMGIRIRTYSDLMKTSQNPTRGKGHSKKTREKLRKAAKKQFSDPKQRELASYNQCLWLSKNKNKGRAVSSIEKKVSQELSRLGIQYIWQRPIRNPKTGRFAACADFFIDGKVLEVNGTYWHSDPRVYPDGPQTAGQLKTAKAYRKKRNFLEGQSIPLFEVWEMDLEKNLEGTIKKILKKMKGK